jgi:hypothetical protein
MKPQGSLPCPQEPATKVYSEPDKSSSHMHSPFLYVDCNMPGFQVLSSLQVFKLNFVFLHLSLHGLHTNILSLDFITDENADTGYM